MLERRTFIVRIHAPDDLPIVEDVATGELVQLPDLASIPGEVMRRLHDSDGIAAGPRNRPSAAPDERP